MSKERPVRRAHAIAVLGTGSDVGKSVLAAGLCRLLARAGRRVAPFKAQNMSLNSCVTPEGGEIGRAQALQAEACGIPAHVDMNPILLKPESDTCAQVVVQGRATGKVEAAAYFTTGIPLFERVQDSYERLARRHEVIVIEGAGSAAEINLRDRDLVNWPVVALADARVVLVADIERGGVFAQVIGTLELLREEERKRVIGIIVNKFRGDPTLFAEGVTFLEQRTGLPVLGVLPFVRPLLLDQEDAVQVERGGCGPFGPERVNLAVLLLPRMSNFTDFNALANEADVALRYARSPSDVADADVILLPGTKNTLHDLDYLAQQGFIPALHAHVDSRRELVGICGGYQMLGRRIEDPDGVEAGGASAGLAFLDLSTVLRTDKTTTLVEGTALHVEAHMAWVVRGYHIHMGETVCRAPSPAFRFTTVTGHAPLVRHRTVPGDPLCDGCVSADGLVWGTYLHGLFDEPGFRRAWLNRIRRRKGLPALDLAVSQAVTRRQQGELDRWADHMGAHLNLGPIWTALQDTHV